MEAFHACVHVYIVQLSSPSRFLITQLRGKRLGNFILLASQIVRGFRSALVARRYNTRNVARSIIRRRVAVRYPPKLTRAIYKLISRIVRPKDGAQSET